MHPLPPRLNGLNGLVPSVVVTTQLREMREGASDVPAASALQGLLIGRASFEEWLRAGGDRRTRPRVGNESCGKVAA